MRNSRLLNVYDVKSEGDNDVAENVENVKWKKKGWNRVSIADSPSNLEEC